MLYRFVNLFLSLVVTLYILDVCINMLLTLVCSTHLKSLVSFICRLLSILSCTLFIKSRSRNLKSPRSVHVVYSLLFWQLWHNEKNWVVSLSLLESWTGPKSEAIHSEAGRLHMGSKIHMQEGLYMVSACHSKFLLEVAANHPRFETLET